MNTFLTPAISCPFTCMRAKVFTPHPLHSEWGKHAISCSFTTHADHNQQLLYMSKLKIKYFIRKKKGFNI